MIFCSGKGAGSGQNNFYILCDLYLEFGGFEAPDVGADVVVLAGDVHAKDRGLQWVIEQKFEVLVLYVLGNHKFYRQEFLAEGGPERSVVVTHHAPSIHSIVDRYKSNPVSAAFASNLDELILEYQPRIWIHGHTHESFDYRIGKARVVCNPRGYVSVEETRDLGRITLRRYEELNFHIEAEAIM